MEREGKKGKKMKNKEGEMKRNQKVTVPNE